MESSRHSPADLLHALAAAATGVVLEGEGDPPAAITEGSLRPEDEAGVPSLALRHRLAPLVHEAARRCATAERLASMLAPYARESAMANAVVLRELRHAAAALEQRGVPHLVFKGAGLARIAYSVPAWRPYGDVDLLVPEDQLQSALTALRHAGYVDLHSHRSDWFRREHYHWSYSRGSEHPAVELHWSFARRGWNLDALWRRAWSSSVAVGSEDAHLLTLALEEHFVALCVHGAKHLWDTLIWVVDLAALVGSGVDAGRLGRLATATGCCGFVHAALLTAERWTGRDLLPELSPAARRDAVAASFASSCAERVAAEVEGRPRSSDPPEAGLLRERGRDRAYFRLMRARGRLVMWARPTATDRRWARLPPALDGLYYLVRPLRVLVQAASGRRRRATGASGGDRHRSGGGH